MEKISWISPTDDTFLIKNNLHIWKIVYPEINFKSNPISNVLHHDEIERANKFYFETDRKRFIVTRAFLKIIMAKILKISPNDIHFSFNKHGKPELEQNIPIHFNISHSGDIGLIAVSDQGPVGIDVERYRKTMTSGKVAKRFFSADEVDTFLSLPEYQRQEGFFNCWTRKEAFIKALGLGLAMPLSNFSVTLKPGIPAQLLSVTHNNEKASDWLLKDIHMENNYAAAYAIKAKKFEEYYWLTNNLF